MSSPNPLIVPKTAAETVQLQGQEADSIVIYVTSALGATETVDILLPTTTSQLRQLISPETGTPVQLTTTADSAIIPGGILYTIRKNATAGSVGVDVQFKPRIGPH